MSAPITTTSSKPLTPTLPVVTAYITGHDSTGKSVITSTRPNAWRPFEENTMAFNVIYTNQSNPDLNNNTDIETHDALLESGKLGLVNPGGTVCRMVDFAPLYECIFHRTQSLDFGIVLEGSIEMILDESDPNTSGAASTKHPQLLHRGDIAVQRATIHAWRNPSSTEWARMCFVLQDCKPLVVAGRRLKEDLGKGTEGIVESGNDS